MREPRPTTMPSRRALLAGAAALGIAENVGPTILRRETDFARRKIVSEEVQCWFWDEVPVVKLGDFFTLRIKQKSVAGYANRYRPFFWNTGLAR